jgi:hypothetical protein
MTKNKIIVFYTIRVMDYKSPPKMIDPHFFCKDIKSAVIQIKKMEEKAKNHNKFLEKNRKDGQWITYESIYVLDTQKLVCSPFLFDSFFQDTLALQGNHYIDFIRKYHNEIPKKIESKMIQWLIENDYSTDWFFKEMLKEIK